MASDGEAIDNGLAVQRNGAARRRRDAEQTLHGFGAAGADKAIEPKNFALAQLEGNIGIFRRVRQAFNGQHDLANGNVALGKNLIDGTADHHAHQLRLGN